MATKVYGVLRSNIGRRLAKLGKRVDGIFHSLFILNLEGQLSKDYYDMNYLCWYGKHQALHKEIDELWMAFVKAKESNDLKVSFKSSKKTKQQRKKSKPFILRTDLGEGFVRLSLTLDNIQVLLTQLALSKYVSLEKTKETTALFYTRIQKLEAELAELEKVKSDVIKAV